MTPNLRCATWLAALGCAVLPGLAWAQVEVPMPSAALSCLTTGASERPAYPEDSLRRKDGGTVKLELEFAGPDAPPRVTVLNENVTFEALTDATRRHVAGFRIPCMAPGSPPVRLRQDYVFVPNDGRKVMSSRPVDLAQPDKAARLSCMSHVDGEIAPAYSDAARREGVEGNVYAELRFTSPHVEPEVRILAVERRKARLTDALHVYAKGLRLPCLTGEAASFRILYHFRLDGGKRVILSDMSLSSFLGAVQQLPPAYFDMNTMGCPFDLRIDYMQPHAANSVGELDTVRPERKPLMDWLSSLRFKLLESVNTSLLGDSFTLHVPCGILDL